MEREYLEKMEYFENIMSLPIEERRAIQKQKLIEEYLKQTGQSHLIKKRKSDDRDLVNIDGEYYTLK